VKLQKPWRQCKTDLRGTLFRVKLLAMDEIRRQGNKSGNKRASGSIVSIAVADGTLAAWSFGSGPAIVFLHGGPGDTHDYMRRMAEPLFSKFQCIFFDQRGTGGSNDFPRIASSYSLELLIEDLKAVVREFGLDRPFVVGHSWGAMYGLFACIAEPQLFRRAALISMGPLTSEMGRGINEHLMSTLSPLERLRWADLRRRRNEARDRGDLGFVRDADREMMLLRVKSWVVNPDLRGPFLQEYFDDPPPDREVNHWIWSHSESWFDWEMLGRIESEVWLCVGTDDSVPLEQTERVAAAISKSTVSIFDRCGHMPYFEHPERFYFELERFLFQS
jgi:pimeloyl-ACP methyl ester carboxylesterase